MSKFHNQKKPHLIYAILWEDDGDEFAFIGKTTTTNTRTLLQRHLRGEVALTASDLHREDWEDKPPRLVILHSLVCTGAEAYRYILCYIRLYEDFGFMTVAHRGTDDQAYDMLPYTKHLYEELQRTVTTEFLSTGIALAKPAQETVYAQKKEPTTQLNVRLDMSTLGAFQRFCSDLGITQREGFIHLMYSVNQDSLSTDPLFVEQRKTIERQKGHIVELETKLQSQSRGQKADAKLKRTIVKTKQLVAQYIAKVAEKPAGIPLKDQACKERTDYQIYQYPSAEGDTTLELKDLYYSHGRYLAAFLCGVDLQNGTPIKLRYYPKENYIGSAPGSKYCIKNARWLVSYQRARDGAMELVAALPWPQYVEKDTKAEKVQDSSSDEKWLEEIILEASMLNGY